MATRPGMSAWSGNYAAEAVWRKTDQEDLEAAEETKPIRKELSGTLYSELPDSAQPTKTPEETGIYLDGLLSPANPPLPL